MAAESEIRDALHSCISLVPRADAGCPIVK
jgi:hypothetical protein